MKVKGLRSDAFYISDSGFCEFLESEKCEKCEYSRWKDEEIDCVFPSTTRGVLFIGKNDWKRIQEEKIMKIVPTYDNVLLRIPKPEKESVTKGGLIVSPSVAKKPEALEVVAVGNGKKADGTVVEMSVKEGDKVLISSYHSGQLTLDGEDYYLVSQDEIIAILA